MGRNPPAETMPFNGMVWRYLITYNVNLLPLTNDCQQRGSTDYALGVAHKHNISRILATIAKFSRSLRLRLGRTSGARDENCTIVPTFNSPFYSRLLCHEHHLSADQGQTHTSTSFFLISLLTARHLVLVVGWSGRS